MNDTFYTYGNKELITQKSFSVIPQKVKPVLQPLVFSLVENMLGVKELRNHLRDFEKIYNLQKSATFKSKIIGNDPLTPTKIRKIRKMLKLTQFQFGNLLGISKQRSVTGKTGTCIRAGKIRRFCILSQLTVLSVCAESKKNTKRNNFLSVKSWHSFFLSGRKSVLYVPVPE